MAKGDTGPTDLDVGLSEKGSQVERFLRLAVLGQGAGSNAKHPYLFVISVNPSKREFQGELKIAARISAGKGPETSVTHVCSEVVKVCDVKRIEKIGLEF